MYLSKVTFAPDVLQSTHLTSVLAGNHYGYHQLLWDLFEQQHRDFLYRVEFAEEQRSEGETLRHSPIFFILSGHEPQPNALFSVQSKEFSPHLAAGMRLDFRLRANPVVTKDSKRHDLVMDEQIAFYQRLSKELGLAVVPRKSQLLHQLKRPEIEPQLQDWLCSYLAQSRYANEINELSTAQLLGVALQESISQRLQYWLTDNPSRQGVMSLANYFVEDELHEQQIEVSHFQWQAYQAHPIPQKGKQAQFRSVDLQGKLIVQNPEKLQRLITAGIGSAKGFGCGLMLIKPARF